MRRPYRYEPNSFTRGYVAGSMFGGWSGALVLLPLILATGLTGVWPVVAIYAAIGALGTFMWFHG